MVGFSTASGRSSRPRLLLTGFGPFPGAPRNPTAEVVTRLAERGVGERLGVDIVPHVFSTTWEALDDLAGLLAEVRPDVVLHLGLKRRATAIAVEAFGRNRVSMAAVDAEGRRPKAPVLDADAPPRLPVSLPVRRIAVRVAGLGLPVEVSTDAGRYLCNGLLWRSLRLSGGRPTGFLHLPPTREIAVVAGGVFTLEALTRATAAAIGVVVGHGAPQP
jgi:pyroglutamyl-peptidase